ncbi:hypothetical protein PMI14_06124 [Acidovorax sp. CF316]|uniref:hypothetical protein n=1 Tax=Acidovorax sp. CF316 TaxID=1144317 RepID=UPI00026BE58B|nr:hypothetical protein [Acidovorax sp. CF316]EJE49326.1 hypothetical protein PMI14_06124 [Acidovorax sp. CF316]
MHHHAAPPLLLLTLPPPPGPLHFAATGAANAATLAQPGSASWPPLKPRALPDSPPAAQPSVLDRFCRSANDPVRDASHHHEARAAESDAQYAAEDAAHRDTLALARGGDYARLLSAMDYRDNDTRAMHALVTCAQQGHALAREAVEVLARTWAETHTEAV